MAIQVADEKIANIYENMKEKSLKEGKYIQLIELLDKELAELLVRREGVEKNQKQILRQIIQEMDAADENLRMISYAQSQIEV
ncbi:hypothetical protein NE599_21935, partial [[Clostridium] symbiosum]|uniref:hypothetical protein n=1 Tax=Clostridium symbiosum TaxID=1512 RepID=UPI00210A84F4